MCDMGSSVNCGSRVGYLNRDPNLESYPHVSVLCGAPVSGLGGLRPVKAESSKRGWFRVPFEASTVGLRFCCWVYFFECEHSESDDHRYTALNPKL